MAERAFSGERSASPAIERHYSVREVADLWGLSPQTITRMFQDQEGVLKISAPRLLKNHAKRAPRVILRIPESVLVRAHEDRSRGWRSEPLRRKG